jgi:hypothetical protein
LINQKFCHPADLLVIYPWALSHAVAGTPRLFRPLVLSARKAALLRNQHWKAKAKDALWEEIIEPNGEEKFWPVKTDLINDHAPRDTGNNFGRIARTGVWDREIEIILNEKNIVGIPLSNCSTPVVLRGLSGKAFRAKKIAATG